MGVNFSGANLAGVQMEQSQIQSTSFKSAVLKSISFVGSQLSKIDFSGADFRGSQLSLIVAHDSLFQEANLAGVSVDQADLRGNDFSKANFEGANLSSANLSQTTMSGASFAKAKLENAILISALMDNCKLTGTFLKGANLTSASLKKSDFRSSILGTADLTKADLTDTDLRNADISKSTLTDAVLKGAKFNKKTLLPFSMEQAQQLGMLFSKPGSVLVLWDAQTADMTAFVTALNDAGADVKMSAKVGYQFDGTEDLSGYDTVIHFNGETYNNDIPTNGQKALVAFVNAGGTFVYSEWNSYDFNDAGIYKEMRDLTLMDRTGGQSIPLPLSISPNMASNPLLTGVPATFTMNTTGSSISKLATFQVNPATALLQTADGTPFMATRTLGLGHVVAFGWTCTYQGGHCLSDPNMLTLYLNTINNVQ